MLICDLPQEIIIEILICIYHMDIGNYVKPDTSYLIGDRNNDEIEEQQRDIINISSTCDYFNKIIKENCMKVIYFKRNIK